MRLQQDLYTTQKGHNSKLVSFMFPNPDFSESIRETIRSTVIGLMQQKSKYNHASCHRKISSFFKRFHAKKHRWNSVKSDFFQQLTSGKLTYSHGKSPCFLVNPHWIWFQGDFFCLVPVPPTPITNGGPTGGETTGCPKQSQLRIAASEPNLRSHQPCWWFRNHRKSTRGVRGTTCIRDPHSGLS